MKKQSKYRQLLYALLKVMVLPAMTSMKLFTNFRPELPEPLLYRHQRLIRM